MPTHDPTNATTRNRHPMAPAHPGAVAVAGFWIRHPWNAAAETLDSRRPDRSRHRAGAGPSRRRRGHPDRPGLGRSHRPPAALSQRPDAKDRGLRRGLSIEIDRAIVRPDPDDDRVVDADALAGGAAAAGDHGAAAARYRPSPRSRGRRRNRPAAARRGRDPGGHRHPHLDTTAPGWPISP